ncbi:MAG: hypothetical protein WDN28_15075 [Chthoniobacter sp.]
MKALFFVFLLLCGLEDSLPAAPEAPTTPTPFRLVFKGYDGAPGQTPVEKFSFQIETLDYKQPAEFLNSGNWIPNTRLKVAQFVFKTKWNPTIQDMMDVSELTVVNPDTGKTAVLILNKGHLWKGRVGVLGGNRGGWRGIFPLEKVGRSSKAVNDHGSARSGVGSRPSLAWPGGRRRAHFRKQA